MLQMEIRDQRLPDHERLAKSIIRRRIEYKYDKSDVREHLFYFAVVSIGLWGLMLYSSGDLLWPSLYSICWGFVFAHHLWTYFRKYRFGARDREELAREIYWRHLREVEAASEAGFTENSQKFLRTVRMIHENDENRLRKYDCLTEELVYLLLRVRRERGLRGVESDETEGAEVYTLDNYQGRGLRLGDDGELIDWETDEDRQLRQKQH